MDFSQNLESFRHRVAAASLLADSRSPDLATTAIATSSADPPHQPVCQPSSKLAFHESGSQPPATTDANRAHPPPAATLPPAKRPRHVGPASPADGDASYVRLRAAVHAALAAEPPALTPAAKMALALELLRARQLELDLAHARSTMHALVATPQTSHQQQTPPPPPPSSPRQQCVRAVVPAAAVVDLPLAVPVLVPNATLLIEPVEADSETVVLTVGVDPPVSRPCDGEPDRG